MTTTTTKPTIETEIDRWHQELMEIADAAKGMGEAALHGHREPHYLGQMILVLGRDVQRIINEIHEAGRG